MAARRRTSSKGVETPRLPARTPEERENQLIDAAVDLAETQLRSGEASAAVVVHFLKLASSREKLEQARLKNEVALLDAKRLALESEQRMEGLIVNALEAMKAYSGNLPEGEGPEYDEYED